MSDDYHTSHRIPGIFIHLSFSSQHWYPSFLQSSLFLSCAHSHLSSSFFSSIISLPKLSSSSWKRSPEPLMHLRFLAGKCHYIVHLIHRGHARAASQWSDSHLICDQTNWTPHGWCDTLCRLLMMMMFYMFCLEIKAGKVCGVLGYFSFDSSCNSKMSRFTFEKKWKCLRLNQKEFVNGILSNSIHKWNYLSLSVQHLGHLINGLYSLEAWRLVCKIQQLPVEAEGDLYCIRVKKSAVGTDKQVSMETGEFTGIIPTLVRTEMQWMWPKATFWL